MVRKFGLVFVLVRRIVMLRALLLLFVAGTVTLSAQDTVPPQQPPPGQETEPIPGRKTRPPDYRKWTFSVGGGANLPRGTTQTFVKGGGGTVTAGAVRNFNRVLGVDLDFMWNNLPLRDSALRLAQAPGARANLYSLSLDPVFNIPVTKHYGGFITPGIGFYHRSGELDSTTVITGSPCNPFFQWWGSCVVNGIPLNQHVRTSSQNALGGNIGFGLTYKLRPMGPRIFFEYAFHHTSHNGITTDVRPVTVGVRW